MPIARSLFVESKKLRIFDFDDVIVRTDSYVYVTKKNGVKLKLTPGQYAVYKEQPGDTFDYSEFQQVTRPVLIKAYAELLRRMSAKGGERGVYILTARGTYHPVDTFIKQLGIKNVTVVGLGDSDPEKKADWIEQQIKDNGYDDIFFIDDSPKNIVAVKRRLSKYPNIVKKIQLAKDSAI